MRTPEEITKEVREDMTVTELKGRIDKRSKKVKTEGPKNHRELYYPVRGTDAMTSTSLAPGASERTIQYRRARIIAEIVLEDIKDNLDLELDEFAGECLYINPPDKHSGGKKGALEILRHTLGM